MNAKKMYLSVFLGVLLLSSCKTARDMVSENDICGEWNVVEIQGESDSIRRKGEYMDIAVATV